MKKPHKPIDNTPHDSPPSPASARPPAPPASSPRLKHIPISRVPVPEVYKVRAPLTTEEERRDTRVYAAVSALAEDTASASSAHLEVEASAVAKYLNTPVGEVLDALERLVGRKLVKLIAGAPVRVLPIEAGGR